MICSYLCTNYTASCGGDRAPNAEANPDAYPENGPSNQPRPNLQPTTYNLHTYITCKLVTYHSWTRQAFPDVCMYSTCNDRESEVKEHCPFYTKRKWVVYYNLY